MDGRIIRCGSLQVSQMDRVSRSYSYNSELIPGSPCMIFNNVGVGGVLVVAYN